MRTMGSCCQGAWHWVLVIPFSNNAWYYQSHKIVVFVVLSIKNEQSVLERYKGTSYKDFLVFNLWCNASRVWRWLLKQLCFLNYSTIVNKFHLQTKTGVVKKKENLQFHVTLRIRNRSFFKITCNPKSKGNVIFHWGVITVFVVDICCSKTIMS